MASSLDKLASVFDDNQYWNLSKFDKKKRLGYWDANAYIHMSGCIVGKFFGRQS